MSTNRYDIHPVDDRSGTLVHELMLVWERAVRATHLFLSDDEIRRIREYVPIALRSVPYLIIARDKAQEIVAFIGIDGKRLEMLFIAPEERGNGLGRRLVEYGIRHYHFNEVCVNEQNPQALGFYEHMGFRAYKRSETDEQGNPYPLVYMRLSGFER